MDDHKQSYGGGSRRGSADAAELHKQHRDRMDAILIADGRMGFGRMFAALGGKHMRKARGAIFSAAAWYMAAGLSRQANAAWRLARLIHRHESRQQ